MEDRRHCQDNLREKYLLTADHNFWAKSYTKSEQSSFYTLKNKKKTSTHQKIFTTVNTFSYETIQFKKKQTVSFLFRTIPRSWKTREIFYTYHKRQTGYRLHRQTKTVLYWFNDKENTTEHSTTTKNTKLPDHLPRRHIHI